jgi:hypothetical protein
LLSEKSVVTSTTARPRPHWFPPESRPPSDWSALSSHLKNSGHNLTAEKDEKSDSKDPKNSETESVTFDPEDFEDESIVTEEEGRKAEEEENVTPRVIKVKVPKVTF